MKEVLSETPILKPTRTAAAATTVNHHSDEVQKFEPSNKPETVVISTPLEVSEVSEMYSTMSESISAATTVTITDKKEDEVTSGQMRQRRVVRSPASVPRKRPHSGEIVGGRERRVRSPAKRLVPTPENRTHIASRPVRGREAGPTTAKRRNVGTDGVHPDSGEISGRRSRSPVTRKESVPTRNVAARAQKLKMTGRNGRNPSPATVDTPTEKSCEVEKPDDGGSTAPNESIENPLVSLECFIFL